MTGKGLAVLPEVGVLGDGAVWIWNLAGEHFGQGVEIVDYYHAGEHVWVVANALYGTGSKQAAAWAGARTKELYEQGADPVIAALGEAQAGTADAGEVLRRERGYFRSNRERMDYPRFRALGLPIGSGAVEGSAKHLVQHRLKRAGMRWSAAGAQGVLSLRAQVQSGRSVAGVKLHRVPVECPRPRRKPATGAAQAAPAQSAA